MFLDSDDVKEKAKVEEGEDEDENERDDGGKGRGRGRGGKMRRRGGGEEDFTNMVANGTFAAVTRLSSCFYTPCLDLLLQILTKTNFCPDATCSCSVTIVDLVAYPKFVQQEQAIAATVSCSDSPLSPAHLLLLSQTSKQSLNTIIIVVSRTLAGPRPSYSASSSPPPPLYPTPTPTPHLLLFILLLLVV
eukprot:748281-Hanusia_phi.AAC.1